ncbi:MAG: hypothetical protein Q4F33_04830 [Mycoplasmatota bacterium]|nr:hypothetical protein [Mycoplasmatota bacterium]
MKIEICEKGIYKIFVNKEIIKNVDYESRDEIVNCVKDILYKLKLRLGLCGFYKIKVFPHNKIGIFLEAIKLDDSEYSNSLDLRVVVYMDERFYFETDDYFVIKECNDKRYFEGLFYCLVDDNFDPFIAKVEFGKFIYGKDVNKVLNNSIIL